MAHKTLEFSLPLPGTQQDVAEAFEYRIQHMDEFPEMENEKTVALEVSEAAIKVRRYLSLEIPKALLSLLPGDYRHLMEEMHYYRQEFREEFSMFFENSRDKFSVDCKSNFSQRQSEPGSEVMRNFTMTVQVNIPLIGGGAASTAAGIFKSGMEKDNQGLAKFIHSRLQAKPG